MNGLHHIGRKLVLVDDKTVCALRKRKFACFLIITGNTAVLGHHVPVAGYQGRLSLGRLHQVLIRLIRFGFLHIARINFFQDIIHLFDKYIVNRSFLILVLHLHVPVVLL